MKLEWRRFADRTVLMQAIAEAVALELAAAVAKRGKAVLVVPGGSTPQVFLQRLATAPLPWPSISISLTDERCVPVGHPARSEAMLRNALAPALTAGARLLPLLEPDGTESIITSQNRRVNADLLVLGMGADGHVASLFPPWPPENPNPVIGPECCRRISRTMNSLQSAAGLWLLIAGEHKAELLRRAERGATGDCGEAASWPVTHLPVPVTAWWAP